MTTPWLEERWARGTLLGLRPDPNSGYRATVWFEYTRHLFNEIREGSLIAIRNFSDRSRNPDGSPIGTRSASYEEYTILQIDQVHPWHYAIQGGGEQGYPGFTVAAAESARTDWTAMDNENRDDVSRIKCEAIPLRLAFRRQTNTDELPDTFFDRSMPMPGFEARVLSADMMRSVLNKGIEDDEAFVLGNHVVQFDVPILIHREDLTRLHFGVFGYTGAGKSNLMSSLVHNILSTGQQDRNHGHRAFKTVMVDLMDEYTGLLIDHLVEHQYSQLVVCGRQTLSEQVFQACQAVAENQSNAHQQATEAALDWSRRLILPSELKSLSQQYQPALANLIFNNKIKFYEPMEQQGQNFDLDIQAIQQAIGAQGYGTSREDRNQRVTTLVNDLTPFINEAENTEGQNRDEVLRTIVQRVEQELEAITAQNAHRRLNAFITNAQNLIGSRGTLQTRLSTNPRHLSSFLNFQPHQQNHRYNPSLTIIIGENEEAIATFVRHLINICFERRRRESILYPTISFIFDEADVFISRQGHDDANLIEPATLLARRGRKFGLGLGIATQRVRFLDTSIMAQPHTYFISKLPRKSDREGVAEAFAISDETFEQTFGFTVGQWLVTSHDATGLKGVPFPVQLPNANIRIRDWLAQQQTPRQSSQQNMVRRR